MTNVIQDALITKDCRIETFNGGYRREYPNGLWIVCFDSLTACMQNAAANCDGNIFYCRDCNNRWYAAYDPEKYFKPGAWIANRNIAMIMGEIPAAWSI